MKKLLALFLIFPIFISAEEQTFEECIAVAESERASEAFQACFTDFEVKDRDSCAATYTETSGYTEEDALEECISLEVSYQYSLFMDDRPTEFFDIFDVKDNLTIESFGCSVPLNDEGLELNNALIVEQNENDEEVSEVWAPFKAMVHIVPELNYAEINYGETIFPLTQYRFFTNALEKGEGFYTGYIDSESDNELKGGNDRGTAAAAWYIDEDLSTLTLFVGEYNVGYIGECAWQEDRMKELEEDLE